MLVAPDQHCPQGSVSDRQENDIHRHRWSRIPRRVIRGQELLFVDPFAQLGHLPPLMHRTSMHRASKLSRGRREATIVAMNRFPRRIAVIGRAGTGKTTIARRLAEAFDLPITHLDALFWTPDWKEVARG